MKRAFLIFYDDVEKAAAALEASREEAAALARTDAAALSSAAAAEYTHTHTHGTHVGSADPVFVLAVWQRQ